MTVLLDGNVLIALSLFDHAHYDAAQRWLSANKGKVASCPITQGTLLRLAIRAGSSAVEAKQLLADLVADSRHEFWSDDIGYDNVDLTGLVGHRQVTDAYLAQLARRHGGRLATFDAGLAALHADIADLVPTAA